MALNDSTAESTSNAEGTSARAFGDPPQRPGELLRLEEKDAAKRALELYRSQKAVTERLEAQWQANAFRRAGYVDVRVVQQQDEARGYIARVPMDSLGNPRSPDTTPHMNKAASLCRKMTGVLTADPPAAEAVPGEAEDGDEDAAEFATRMLAGLDEEMGEIDGLTDAIDRSHSSASVFRRYFYNEYGGLPQPVAMKAGFDPETGEVAGHVDEAEFRNVSVPPDPDAVQQAMLEVQSLPEPTQEQQAWPDFRERMVKPDGSLTDERKDAATQRPGCIEAENLTGNNVRLIPHTCSGVEDAHGAQVLVFVPWGKLRQSFPKLGELKDEDRDKILSFRPQGLDSAYPPGQKKRYEEMAKGSNVDEKPCLTLTTYYTGKKSGDYPMGLYMLQLGDSYVVHRGELSYTGEDGVKQAMMLPLAQYRLFTEGRDHPYGVGLMEIVGPGGEVRAAVLAAALDALDRITSAKTFVDVQSQLQEEELLDRTRRYVVTNVGTAGTPTTEQVQGLPTEAEFILTTLTTEMNDASGLQETGQGLENSKVTSGVQAMAVVSQVQAALSPQARAVVRPYLRGCRIRLELVRAHYSIERQSQWMGEDGRYKRRAWSRTDIGSTADVRLKAGTMSLLTPMAKALLAGQFSQSGLLPPDEYREAMEHNLGGTLALQSDPFRMRIRRQLADLKDFPPEGWQPPQAPTDPATGMPAMQQGMDEAGNQTLLPVPAPVDPLLIQIFQPVPSDTMPQVAQVRLNELSKFTATLAYLKLPQEGRAALDQELARMQQVVAMSQMAQQQSPDQPGRAEGEGEQPGRPKGDNGLTRTHAAAASQAQRFPVQSAGGVA